MIWKKFYTTILCYLKEHKYERKMFSDQVADHLVKYDEQFGDENPMNNMSNFIANLSLNDQADSKW